MGFFLWLYFKVLGHDSFKSCSITGLYSANLYLPSQELLNKMKLEDYYVYAYDVHDGYESMWNINMSISIQENDEISYKSKLTYENQFKGYINAILTLGICVSIILGIEEVCYRIFYLVLLNV